MKPKPETRVPGGGKAARRRKKFGLVRVADYRLYGLDGVDKVASGVWFDAEDDRAAIEAARTLMDGHDCELWQGRRFVARLAAPGSKIHLD
jgi:hypothetical protein